MWVIDIPSMMCYDYVFILVWILSTRFAAMSTNSTISTTSSEAATMSLAPTALPIVWRTTTSLPIHLLPPAPPTPSHGHTTKHSNHNYDNMAAAHAQNSHINNATLWLDADQRHRDSVRAYGDSFPVLLNTSRGISGESARPNVTDVTLMGYANNPFGSRKSKTKLCYNTKKCNTTTSLTTSTTAPTLLPPSHTTNLLDTGQLPLPPPKPGDIYTAVDQPTDGTEPRYKRGVIHLYNMVSCATGCNPLIYKGYGCYCGFLGSGYAVDGIDRCCKFHDWCYDTAKCPMYLEYFIPYYWKCYHRKPICAVEHGEWGGAGSCAQRLCECDRVLSECLSRYPCPSRRAICTSSPWRLLQNAFMIL